VLAIARRASSQTNASAGEGVPSYNLRISVDEVSLTFHAADAHGFPVNDLKVDELRLLDNSKPPRRVISFQSLENFPIRAGILMDTSESMRETRTSDRAIAIEFARQLFRQRTDQAFIVNFDFLSKMAQPWTNDVTALVDGIRNRNGAADRRARADGTAVFDTIYGACMNQFGHIDNAASGNFILLFSDGEDNASRASLQQAVDMCQRANTAIYAFHPEPRSSFSTGPKTLIELTSETGGRVFYDDDSEAKINEDLRAIEADLRNQYRLIYKPPDLKRDGSFHRVELRGPERVDSINIRSGYYAPGLPPRSE
jgi:VWFA-related protein